MAGVKQDQTKILRLSKDTLADVERVVASNKDLYASVSHFIRCAVIEKVRRENE